VTFELRIRPEILWIIKPWHRVIVEHGDAPEGGWWPTEIHGKHSTRGDLHLFPCKETRQRFVDAKLAQGKFRDIGGNCQSLYPA